MLLNLSIALMLALFPNINPLEKFEWNNRVLLFYGNETAFDEYQNFKKFNDEIEDRDMVLIWTDGKNLESMPTQVLPTEEGPLVVKYLALDRYKTNITILIGKDGNIKKKYNLVIPRYVFDLIDSMPMRKNEIRKKQMKEQSQPDE